MKQNRLQPVDIDPAQPNRASSSPSEYQDKLLKEKEAAPIVGLSVRTLQQRRYLRLPPDYVKVPGTRAIRYRLSDLLAYVEQGLQRLSEGIL